jgi:hypothetical protein
MADRLSDDLERRFVHKLELFVGKLDGLSRPKDHTHLDSIMVDWEFATLWQG